MCSFIKYYVYPQNECFVIILDIPKLPFNFCGGVTKEDDLECVFPAEEGNYIRMR